MVFYEDKPQEEVAGGGGSVWVGRVGVGRRREVCPGLSIPRNRQDGRTRNRWCIPKVAPTRGVHRLYVTEPPPEVGIGWDGMGVLWEVVRGIFCLSSLSSHLFRLGLFLRSLPGHVATSPQAKVCSLASKPPLPFPTQPQQLSSFEASAKKSCEKGAA